MAEKDKDRLADALAALAGGEHQETEEQADDIHGHAATAEPAAEAVAPPPARPVQAPRPPARAPVAPPVRPVAPRVAPPQAPRPAAPQVIRPPAPPAPAKVRPAAPPVMPAPIIAPAPEAPLDAAPPSSRRPATPELGITSQPASEVASPSEFVSSEMPAAEQVDDQVAYDQPAATDANGQDEFAAAVDEYAEEPSAEQVADDEVFAPAPEVADFMKQRYDPLLRGLSFKRTLIPIFLVLGGLFLLAPLFGWAFTAEESGFRMLPTWYPFLLIVFGIALLAFAGVTMMQVKFLLKRQADLAARA